MGKRLFVTMMLVAAAAVMPAQADDRGYGRDSRRDGSGYGYGGNYGGSYGRNARMGGNPVMAAMRDLESIFRRARVDHHEANHFRRALQELDEFDRRAARGRFDRGSLDTALDNMADLAQADQLHPRDRHVIGRHIQSLRYVRERSRY